MATETIQVVLKIRDDGSVALGEVEDAAKRAGDRMDEAGASSKAFGVDLKTLAAAGLAAGAAFAGLVKQLADAKNLLSDTATRTGLTAQTIAGLDLAARGSGQSLQELSAGLSQFPKRLADAQRGTGEAKIAFEELGIQQRIVSGELSTADDVLRAFLGELGKVNDPTRQAALATQALGESGTKLLQAVGPSAEALDAFADRARILGVSMSDAAAGGAADLQRSLADLETALLGVADRMVSAFAGESGFAGLIDNFVTGLTAASTFIVRRWEQVGIGIGGVIVGLSDLIDALIEGVQNLGAAMLLLAQGDFGGAARLFGEARGSAKDELRALTTEVGGLINAAFSPGAIGEAFDDALRAAQDEITSRQRSRAGGGAPVPGGAAPIPAPIAAAVESEVRAAEAQADAARAAADEQREIARRLGVLSADIATTADDLSAGFDGVVDSLNMATDELVRQIRQEAGRRTAMDIAGVGAALAVGDPRAALGTIGAATGPVGMGVTQGLGFLAQVGETGPEGVRAQLEGFTDAVIAGLEALPEILSEVIPDFVESLISELIPALIEAAPELFRALNVELPIAIAKAIVEGLRDLFGGLLGGGDGGAGGALGRTALAIGTGGLSEVFRGRFQSGGFVDRTGLALVHQGERIVPNTGAATASAMGGGGGRSTSINVQGSIYGVDDLISVLDGRLGFGGGGRSTVLGGG